MFDFFSDVVSFEMCRFPFIICFVMMVCMFIFFNRMKNGFFSGRKDSDQEKTPYQNHNEEEPISIIKRRYANGKISKDQFEAMKKDLQ